MDDHIRDSDLITRQKREIADSDESLLAMINGELVTLEESLPRGRWNSAAIGQPPDGACKRSPADYIY